LNGNASSECSHTRVYAALPSSVSVQPRHKYNCPAQFDDSLFWNILPINGNFFSRCRSNFHRYICFNLFYYSGSDRNAVLLGSFNLSNRHVTQG